MAKKGLKKGTKLGKTPKRFNARQLKTLEYLKSGKAKSRREAMLMAGYSEYTSKAGSVMKRSGTWKELMDTFLPDDILLEKHSGLLNAKKIVYVKGEGVQETEYPDHSVIDSALDMAYKLKGRYKNDVSITVKDRLGRLSNDELEQVIAAIGQGKRDIAEGIVNSESGESTE